MSDPKSPACPRCGAALSAGSDHHLCPACLLSGAVAEPSDEAVTLPPCQPATPRTSTGFPRDLGAYRLLGLLGRGGMGTVYEAEHFVTGRRVALKTLDQRFDSADMRQRFLREGRLAARVNHPNSLYVFGSEEIDGTPVITMEIASGGTLGDRLEKSGPFPLERAVDAILDVISGLEAASAVGVLHRDVKPANCFIEPDGSVKVGDYGLSISTLAKEDSLVTAAGVIMGTPAFAPPEQLRGDELSPRADIYSVGATLFALLTGQAPFGGQNVVQVVANAMNQDPKPLSALREGVPPGLEKVVARCLMKDPEGRFPDYMALRNALLPFSSREPEPASFVSRLSAGWIDYLIAFLPPYLALMFLVGGDALIVRPLVERTLASFGYYFLLFACGFLYFTILEGIWGCGLGKWLKGLRVIGAKGRPPGVARALVRVLIPILCVEGVRVPVTMAFISEPAWTGLQTALFVITAVVCGWIPGLLALGVRRENGYATVWDRVSGTRVILKRKGTVRPSVTPLALLEASDEDVASLGPYHIAGEVIAERWLAATDPVLHRAVWLLRRDGSVPSAARREVARPGRLRWLQKVETAQSTWDAYEAVRGRPLCSLVEAGKRAPWGTLRHWLHDLASELWNAAKDQTLPTELSPDQVWITAEGRAMLLEEPWPDVDAAAERIPVEDVAGQQEFLDAVAEGVDRTSLPVHARPVLQNLEAGRFEKLSYLAGTLRGALDKPAVVTRGIRAGSLFLLPTYLWIAFFVGRYHDKPSFALLGAVASVTALVLFGAALIQFLALPFGCTASQAIFRLAVVNAKGERPGMPHALMRWAIAWLPVLLPLALLAPWREGAESSVALATTALALLWICAAAYAVVRPNRGLHDCLAGTWVVRR